MGWQKSQANEVDNRAGPRASGPWPHTRIGFVLIQPLRPIVRELANESPLDPSEPGQGIEYLALIHVDMGWERRYTVPLPSPSGRAVTKRTLTVE